MEQVTLIVKGMSCHHCVRAIEGSVGQLAGVRRVKVHLNEERVDVEFTPSDTKLDQIKETIKEKGYEVL